MLHVCVPILCVLILPFALSVIAPRAAFGGVRGRRVGHRRCTRDRRWQRCRFREGCRFCTLRSGYLRRRGVYFFRHIGICRLSVPTSRLAVIEPDSPSVRRLSARPFRLFAVSCRRRSFSSLSDFSVPLKTRGRLGPLRPLLSSSVFSRLVASIGFGGGEGLWEFVRCLLIATLLLRENNC